MANKHRSNEGLKEIDAVVERLREFIRLNYVTATEIARQLGVRDGALYSWMKGEFKPANPERITSFLESMSVESGLGIAPTGYVYREYKNWRGIPRPRCCPFCKSAKGEVRRVRGGHQGVCPNREASGPKKESHDEALKAWNGKA